MTRVWRLVTHNINPDQAITWSNSSGRIAVGWGHCGDLRLHALGSASDISIFVRQRYPRIRNANLAGPSLWNFYNRMQIGDLVILSNGKRRISVVEISGDYDWNKAIPAFMGDYYNQRSVLPRNMNADDLWRRAGGAPGPGQNRRWPVIECAATV